MALSGSRIGLLLSLLIPFVSPSAAVIRVPSRSPTIQRALESASPGDTIRVAPGIYREAPRVEKPIVLLGGCVGGEDAAGGAARETAIDGAGLGRSVLTIVGEEGEAVLVRGFTIRNGSVPGGSGGGIVVLGNVRAAIEECVIRDNDAGYHGGGVCFLMGATGRLERNRILENVAGFHGGGVCLLGRARVEVLGNVLAGNKVLHDSGGGIAALQECVLTAIGNRLEENSAGKKGGAISAAEDCDVALSRNLLAGNACGTAGGAVYASRSALRMEENTLVRNYGPLTGGIVLAQGRDAAIRRNIVARCGGAWLLSAEGPAPALEGNVVYACASAEGILRGAVRGALFADPLFCDEATDQRLRPASPCWGPPRAGCFRARCGEARAEGDPPLGRALP
jgi:predicted outer membrane repeat protein